MHAPRCQDAILRACWGSTECCAAAVLCLTITHKLFQNDLSPPVSAVVDKKKTSWAHILPWSSRYSTSILYCEIMCEWESVQQKEPEAGLILEEPQEQNWTKCLWHSSYTYTCWVSKFKQKMSEAQQLQVTCYVSHVNMEECLVRLINSPIIPHMENCRAHHHLSQIPHICPLHSRICEALWHTHRDDWLICTIYCKKWVGRTQSL